MNKYEITWDEQYQLIKRYDLLRDTGMMNDLPKEIEIRDLALGVWDADDEDDLIEEVTTACGWCIKNIDYEIQLK